LGEHRPGELIESQGFDKTLEEKFLVKNATEWLGLSME
jgi:hypothetical protein